MYYLAFSNIKFRFGRSFISVFVISIGIALILILTGLTHGTIQELVNRIKQVGADIVVQPADGNFFMGLKSAVLPRTYADEMEKIQGVQNVVPIVTWIAKLKRQMHVVYGVDLDKFRMLGKKFFLLQGREFSKSTGKPVYEVMFDDRLLKATGHKLNDQVRLLGKKFTIVGVYRQGIGARMIMPVQTLQDKLDQGDKVSFFYLKCASVDSVKDVADKIQNRFSDLRVNASNQFEDIIKKSLSGLNDFVAALTIVVLLISSLVVLLAMYTTVLERTREIGILKALGASNFFVATQIVFEAIILSVFGVGVGWGLFFLVKKLLKQLYPLLTVHLTTQWLGIALIIGMVVGALGALFPAYLAARQDPVKVLRYE